MVGRGERDPLPRVLEAAKRGLVRLFDNSIKRARDFFKKYSINKDTYICMNNYFYEHTRTSYLYEHIRKIEST
jgi:hypothetical protein